jgi:2-haloacid dehalogenase
MAQPPITAVVFDIGGVLLDWNPRHLYRSVFDEPDEADRFLREVCTFEWHVQHDRGTPMDETIPHLVAQHPHYASEIEAWRDRYIDMVAGYIDGMVELLTTLRDAGVAIYALSNMPSEMMPRLRLAYPVMDEFAGVIVSGDELVMKPDPRIYRLLTERFGLRPEHTVFVDDMPANVDAAWQLGFRAVRFESAPQLRAALRRWGVGGLVAVETANDHQ